MATAPDRPVRKQRGGSIDKAWEDRVREKIRKSRVVNRLIRYVEGKISLEAGQVTAALGLLKKTLPDLAQSEVKHSGEITIGGLGERLDRALARLDGGTGSAPR